jgi:hypothetical protein
MLGTELGVEKHYLPGLILFFNFQSFHMYYFYSYRFKRTEIDSGNNNLLLIAQDLCI